MIKSTLVIFTLFVFFSCDKDDNECETTAQDIAGSYRVTAATYRASSTSAEVDYYNTLYSDPRERDDIVTFNANGTYTFADAGVQCVPSGNDTGTWSLVSATSITIDGDALTLESFNCQQLVISNFDTQIAGVRLKLTLTRQ